MSASFPILNTGVVAQYSTRRAIGSRVAWSAFLGEASRSQTLTNKGIKAWQLKYTNLAPEEAFAIRQLFESSAGGGDFSFPDPWTGQSIDHCRFSQSALRMKQTADLRFELEVEVEHAE